MVLHHRSRWIGRPRCRLEAWPGPGLRPFGVRSVWRRSPGQGRGNESVAQGAGTGDAAASTGDEDGQKTGDGGEDGHSKSLPFAEHATHPDSTGLSIPEASFISVDRARRPLRALVTDPSGAVLLGMNVQHCSPNMAQTPPFSARSMSRATRFWKAIREVAASWVEMPSTASRVRLARRCTL